MRRKKVLFSLFSVLLGITLVTGCGKESEPKVNGKKVEKINAMDDFTPENIRTAIKQLCKETGHKGAAVYMPIRAAVTGECHGPDIDKIMALMGKEKVLARLSGALK